jgi:hypothetical protein
MDEKSALHDVMSIEPPARSRCPSADNASPIPPENILAEGIAIKQSLDIGLHGTSMGFGWDRRNSKKCQK